MQSVVSVSTRWGDYVLGVRDLRRGESLSVGSPPRRLLSFRSGSPVVWGLQPDDEQRERPLGPGESVTVTCGALDYTLSCSGPVEAPSFAATGRHWAFWDALALGLILAVLGWHVGPAGAVARLVPQALHLPAQRTPLEPEQDRPAPHRIFAVVAEPEAKLGVLPGDLRCGNEQLGHDFFETSGRYAAEGPKDNADPHLARPVPGQGYPTAHGLLLEGVGVPQAQQGSASPTAPFGRDAALGTDDTSARGRMWGDMPSEQTGDGGLGLAYRSGGVVKSFDVAPLADNHAAELRVVHTGLRVSDARKASEVARAMAAHLGDFRACAESADPAAQRRVQLEFDVAADGRASATSPSGDALEQCLNQSMTAVLFAPGASDVAHVVYPLYFTAAQAAVQSPRAALPPATPCDCSD